jgi:hypothetical protein
MVRSNFRVLVSTLHAKSGASGRALAAVDAAVGRHVMQCVINGFDFVARADLLRDFFSS